MLHKRLSLQHVRVLSPCTRKGPKTVYQTLTIPTLQQLPHSRRIEQSLELRRLISNLVMSYKIVFRLTCLKMSDYFVFSLVCVISGHPYKL